MTASNLDLIYEDWKSSLKGRDRSAPSVVPNFEELFERLKSAGATFEEAHAVLPKAIKAHQPPAALARLTYKNLKSNPKVGCYTEKEFVDQWNHDISDKATSTFYSIFPVPKGKDDDDGEPKVFGNMSVKEYRAQRRYANQFPVLDTEELERRVLGSTYNPMEDVQDILGKKDGDGNDTN